jgi:hypothetical protein
MLRLSLFSALLPLALSACGPTPQADAEPPQAPTATRAAGVSLTAAQKARIGQKIWHNESGGTVKGLTHWNEGEEFPSLGIGHFIWYPKGFQGRWTETFPEFIRFAKSRGVQNVPAVAGLPDCPWNSKAAFYQDFDGTRLAGLRTWLSKTIPLQTEFIMDKSRAALPEALAAAPAGDRTRIQQNYNKVATTPQGIYALIDYVNFKGSGTNPTERYAGQGWGLMWVLREMREVPAGSAAAVEFGNAAKRCLDRRITNSPPERGESRWREGWHNRCEGYGKPL